MAYVEYSMILSLTLIIITYCYIYRTHFVNNNMQNKYPMYNAPFYKIHNDDNYPTDSAIHRSFLFEI